MGKGRKEDREIDAKKGREWSEERQGEGLEKGEEKTNESVRIGERKMVRIFTREGRKDGQGKEEDIER